MPIFEAMNAAEGDTILMRFQDPNGHDRIWLIDGGPKASAQGGHRFYPLTQSLLPRLAEIREGSETDKTVLDLVVCTHVDDDHINGIERLMRCKAEPDRCASGENVSVADAPIEIGRVWFNSFSALLGPEAMAKRPLASLPRDVPIGQSIGQGDELTRHLTQLRRLGNPPIDGIVRQAPTPFLVNGVPVIILAPGEAELAQLRAEWMEEDRVASPTPQGLAPKNRLDDSVANLSSIVMLVEFPSSDGRVRRALLTGDARGDHVVRGYHAAGRRHPLPIDVMKVPHHGAYANMHRSLLETFPADHYVFSANGKHDNPDPPVVEALVRICARDRPITLHFTNEVTWSKPFRMEGGQVVQSLREMKAVFDAEPNLGAQVAWKFRAPEEHSVAFDF